MFLDMIMSLSLEFLKKLKEDKLRHTTIKEFKDELQDLKTY